MPPSSKSSPKKRKKKVAVNASYGGISFDKHAPAEASEGDDDPLAAYRTAAAAAAKALEKEVEEEAKLAFFTQIFEAMDINGDGKVELAEMIEAVAANTSPLSHRVSSEGRPTGAINLQLPMSFTLDHWTKEMRRMQTEMDAATFEVNAMGLLDCFKSTSISAGTAGAGGLDRITESPAVDRMLLLNELFATMDDDSDGLISVDTLLKQARGSTNAQRSDLFDFLASTFVGSSGKQLSRDEFAQATLIRTPLGRLRGGVFASAVRALKADVQRISSIRVAMQLAHGDAAADKRLGLLNTLFNAMDADQTGVVTMSNFVAQAKTSIEAEELKADFQSFDQVGSEQPDGMLTFRKFVAGTLETPLGRLHDEAFERAVTDIIENLAAPQA